MTAVSLQDLKILRPLIPTQLSDLHMRCLIGAMEMEYTGRGPLDVIAQCLRMQSMIWGWDKGILVTEIMSRFEGPELFVSALFGRGYFNKVDDFKHDLQLIAQGYGCVQVGALFNSDYFAKFLGRVGTVRRGTYAVLELEN